MLRFARIGTVNPLRMMSTLTCRVPPPATVVLSKIRGLEDAFNKRGFDVSKFFWADPSSLTDEDQETLAICEVIIGEPGVVAPILHKCPKLKWLQSTFAGCNQLLDHPRRDYVATRLSGVFGPDMAEYVAMHILTRERAYMEERARQASKEWLGAHESATGTAGEFRRLSDLNLGVLGLGDIGSEIARAMKAGFRMRTLGCRARPSTTCTPFVDKVYGIDELRVFLAECDYVVSVLPSTPATRGLLGGEALKAMQLRQGVLINVGRGDVLPESDALQALNEGWIAHLVADVFEVEPLPPSSPLWSHPKVTVSPHVSAVSKASDVVEAFAANAELYASSGVSALNHKFDFDRGY